MYCNNCKKEFDDNLDHCPGCGTPQPAQKSQAASNQQTNQGQNEPLPEKQVIFPAKKSVGRIILWLGVMIISIGVACAGFFCGQKIVQLIKSLSTSVKKTFSQNNASNQQQEDIKLQQENVEQLYKNGMDAYDKKDFVTAASYFKKAANQGYARAQTHLGYCYERGEGVDKNFEQAAFWYRKAADQGEKSAQNNLGYCYQFGTGVSKDYRQAFNWYRKAAEQGHATAQYNLGLCYMNGDVVQKNYNQAVYWFRKSAEQGYSYGQNSLGCCYEFGYGVEKDRKKAIEWYKKAARQGHKTAQDNLKKHGIYSW